MESFKSKYSESHIPLDKQQKLQYEKLKQLVLNFNENLKGDVIKSKDKYNQKIRNVIADKTGLSLNYKAKYFDLKLNDNVEKTAIKISIEDYVPLSLINLFEKFDDNHIEMLLHYNKMKSSVKEIEYQIDKFNSFSRYVDETIKIEDLLQTLNYLKKLIIEVEDSGLIEALKSLGPDSLGAYFVHENRVELYWLSIGLCQIIHNFSVEDFTLVVLTHELVHGYSHIGYDKDGNNWDTKSFYNSDLKIVEGFAQLYTEMICEDFFEQAIDSFNCLLSNQSIEYTDYKNWFSERESYKYEKARRILLKSRQKQIINYDEFIWNLNKIKEEF